MEEKQSIDDETIIDHDAIEDHFNEVIEELRDKGVEI